jgi:hypothetical protein
VELNLAASQSLTQVARGWLHGYLGLCLMRMGRPQEAMTQLRAGRDLLPEEPQVQDWLVQVSKDPRSQVDQQVTMSQIRKADRPMWEGVEEEQEARRQVRPTPPTNNEVPQPEAQPEPQPEPGKQPAPDQAQPPTPPAQK